MVITLEREAGGAQFDTAYIDSPAKVDGPKNPGYGHGAGVRITHVVTRPYLDKAGECT